jgi:hypothetical protein
MTTCRGPPPGEVQPIIREIFSVIFRGRSRETMSFTAPGLVSPFNGSRAGLRGLTAVEPMEKGTFDEFPPS